MDINEIISHFVRAFVVGGGVCLLGQLLLDVGRLTPAHTMSVLVTAGAVLGAIGLWPALVEFAGFGARLPIVNFGSLLVEGAMQGAARDGFIGLLSGMLKPVSAGLAAAVAFGFVTALVFKPKA